MSIRDLTVQITEQGYKELQNKVGKLEKQLAKLSKKNTKVKIDSSGIDTINKKLSSMGNLLKVGVVSAFAYKGAKAFANWVDEVENLDNKIKSTGLSAEMYQSITKQAAESGISVEAIATAMVKFNKVSADTKDTRSADERLLSLANHLKGIKDPAKMSAEAMKYMGKGGAQLIPIMMGGAESIKKMTSELQANGSILSQGSIDKALKVDAAFDKIGRTIDSVKNKVFGAIAEEVLSDTSDLTIAIDNLSKIDFSPIISAVTSIVAMSVDFLSNIAKGFELWRDNKDIDKSLKEDEARRYFDKKKGIINFNETSSPKYGGIKSAGQSFADTNPKLNDFLSTDFGKLKKVEFLLKESLNKPIEKKFIEQLYNIQKEGSQRSKDESMRLLKLISDRQGGVTLPTIKAEVKEKEKDPKGLPKGKEKGGGSSASGFSDPFLSTLIHFKNEFIVFADKLLRAQGIISGSKSGASLRTVGDINIQVDVTGASGDPQATGDAVAKAIVVELKKLVTANNNAVTAINNHADVVKTATTKTAGLNTPASSPIYQLQA